MNTYNIRMPLGCMMTVLVLAGCSSGNNNAGPAQFAPAPAQNADGVADTLAARATEAAASDEAIVLPTNGRNINYGTGEPTLTEGGVNISLAYADGGYNNEVQSVTVETSNGSLTFERNELVNAAGFEKRDADNNNLIADLFVSHGGGWDDYANRVGHYQFMIPLRRSIVNDDESIDRSYEVVGLETTAAAMAERKDAMATATYTGSFKGDAYVAGETTRTELLGDVILIVNFGMGKITGGSIRELGGYYPLVIAQSDIDITGNGFNSTVSCSVGEACDHGEIADGSSFAGTFYGDRAQETGGTANWNWKPGADSMLTDHTVGAVWTAAVDDGV